MCITNRNFLKELLLHGALFFLMVLFRCSNQENRKPVQDQPSHFNEDFKSYYLQTLDSAAHYLTQMDTSKCTEENQRLFLHSRKWYKMAEPMIIAYDHENYKTINGPNLLRVVAEDFTDVKKIEPTSYQVLEEELFSGKIPDQLILHKNINFLSARLPFIRNNNMIYDQRDQHHLKMVRDVIVNIATKGITGFDSPSLHMSLQEAIYSYESLAKIILIYQEAFNDKELYDMWLREIDVTKKLLAAGDFDSFNRYIFIKDHINPQLSLLKRTAEDFGIELNTSRPLNPASENLFAGDFFNVSFFTPPRSPEITDDLVNIGKALFNDPSLSKTGNMSCASCHIKELAFTDGLSKARGINDMELQRNSPTMTYATFQYKFFHDGRASALESQIMGVLNNTHEFHTSLKAMTQTVSHNEGYVLAFDAIYPDGVNQRNIRNAIAAYIRDQSPFNSKFDRNMQGKESTLTDEEIHGFNLFMGKAACATCHFPPAFNGTVPPKYLETEFENLGVPAIVSFIHPKLDSDPGAFYPFEVEERKGFFKTPTIRNIELTGPYMHNGVYDSLEQVVRFYNFGGGAGMGLDVPYQTLPADSLLLSDKESEAIIAFMKTLTDEGFSSK
ncbi:MAG: cytochrome c peroxidase [Cyclobacteriaceae bacterium]